MLFMCLCFHVRRLALRKFWVFLLPVSQFQVLRDLLENYCSSDCECSSPCSSLSTSRIPKSHLILAEKCPLALSLDTGVLVYSCRKKLGKPKLVVDGV